MSFYDVIVTVIVNKRAFTVLAHHLAQKPGVSLQKAQSMIAQLPVVYDEHISNELAKDTVVRLAKMGVTAFVRNSQPTTLGSSADMRPVETAVKNTEFSQGRPAPVKPLAVVKTPAVDAAGRLANLTVAAVRDDQSRVKRKMDTSAIVLIVTIGLVGAMLGLIASQRNRHMDKTPVALVKGEGENGAESKKEQGRNPVKSVTSSGGTKQDERNPDLKTPVPEDQKAASQSYVDSANAAQSDPDAAVRFFKMAISLNPKNSDAWYGLMNAYSAINMPKEAEETRVRMIELFGEAATTVSEVMKEYGPVQEASLTEEGTYRIEYRTRQSGESRLTEEAFRLSKALRVSCECTALSLFASQGKGKGLLVHLSLDNFPQSYDDFLSAATIRYLE